MRNFISYMITDPEYSLSETINAIKKHSPTFVCYRNKNYYDEKEITEFAKKAGKLTKIFINLDNVENKEILNLFDGIHIPSSKLKEINKFQNKILIASTHNIKEVLKAKNADFITFSPIFDSKNRKGLGIEKINEIYSYHQNIIALGGITDKRKIEEIKKSKAVGFAAIRYFFT